MLRHVLVLVLACSGLVLAMPAAAGAATRSQIIRDCEDDSRLSNTYSPSELRDARENLDSDTAAYSDCADVLRTALAASARRRAAASGAADGGSAGARGGDAGGSAAGGGGPASGTPRQELNTLDTEAAEQGSPAPSPEDLKALRSIRENLPEVDVRGQRVVPGVRGVAGQAATATVPTSLVVVLVLLGITSLLAAAAFVHRRVLLRRR